MDHATPPFTPNPKQSGCFFWILNSVGVAMGFQEVMPLVLPSHLPSDENCGNRYQHEHRAQAKSRSEPAREFHGFVLSRRSYIRPANHAASTANIQDQT